MRDSLALSDVDGSAAAHIALNDFERVKLVHVPREMNRAADEMSNRAIDERM